MDSISSRKPELLAPAGRVEVFHAVLEAGADAVYVAGKQFNMRRHRSDVNFSAVELERLLAEAHGLRRKVYVAVNALVCERELPPLSDWLHFLAGLGVDALIVQDLAVVRLCREHGLRVPLHSSTMMNVGCGAHAELLKNHGFARAVTSRDITVEEVRRIRETTGIEVEYFVHGDMCSVQSGQCLSSGIIFGKSSNRGQCMKPCRWAYDLLSCSTGRLLAEKAYLLAAKDLCLAQHLPDLIAAGVDSLKIEGRMRNAGALAPLVAMYRDLIDTCCREPLTTAKALATTTATHRSRVRELSTGFAFRTPDDAYFDMTGEREPVFLSRFGRLETVRETPLPRPTELPCCDPEITVVVGTPEAAREALGAAPDSLVLSWEGDLTAESGWQLQDVRDIVEACLERGCRPVMGTPRIVTERECAEVRRVIEAVPSLKTFCLTSVALIPLFRPEDTLLWADAPMNILNSAAARVLRHLGIRRIMPAPEASLQSIAALRPHLDDVELEVPVHGPMVGMVVEHCLLGMATQHISKRDFCQMPCAVDTYALRDAGGTVRPLRTDRYCRNHILLEHHLAMLSAMDSIRALTPAAIRIDTRLYPCETIAPLLALYRRSLDVAIPVEDSLKALSELFPDQSFTYGAYPRGIADDDRISRLALKRGENRGAGRTDAR